MSAAETTTLWVGHSATRYDDTGKKVQEWSWVDIEDQWPVDQTFTLKDGMLLTGEGIPFGLRTGLWGVVSAAVREDQLFWERGSVQQCFLAFGEAADLPGDDQGSFDPEDRSLPGFGFQVVYHNAFGALFITPWGKKGWEN